MKDTKREDKPAAEEMKNIPERIWVQIGENVEVDDFKELEEEEITWSSGKVFLNESTTKAMAQ